MIISSILKCIFTCVTLTYSLGNNTISNLHENIAGNYHSTRHQEPNEMDCPDVKGEMEDRRSNKNHLRIMQYNVEWLFTEYYAPADCPGDGCPWHNETAAHTHIRYVSKVINDLEPDIINLCEIQGCVELEELIENLTYKDEYRKYVIQGEDTSTGQNVGMITKIDPSNGQLYRNDMRIKYPLPESKCGYDGSGGTIEVSKHYITELKLGDKDIALVGAHFLAMPTDPDRCAKREAQAAIIRNIVDAYMEKKFEVIVMGDFNDYDNEILDINNHIPTSRVLDIIKKGLGEDEKDHSNVLVSSEEMVKKEDRYSLWWDENGDGKVESSEYALIDYILVTPTIYNWIENVVVYHGYEEGLDIYNSDHYPIFVDMVMKY
jgi:exonuclease III